MPAGHDQARRPQYGRRSQDGTDIVRIGYLIEHHDRATGCRCSLDKRSKIGVCKRFDFRHRALMYGFWPGEAVEIAWRSANDVDAARRQRISKAAFRILRQMQTPDLATLVCERGGDGVSPPDEKAIFPGQRISRVSRLSRCGLMLALASAVIALSVVRRSLVGKSHGDDRGGAS
jgi:hypothetical protein